MPNIRALECTRDRIVHTLGAIPARRLNRQIRTMRVEIEREHLDSAGRIAEQICDQLVDQGHGPAAPPRAGGCVLCATHRLDSWADDNHTHDMSKRLQVLLEESELKEIRRIAREKRMTVAEWVRQALRTARKEVPASNAGRKLEIVRAAARHSFPTADIESMLAEISRGYGPGDER